MIKGKIEKLFENEKNFVIVVNGEKYGGFGKLPTELKVGDNIQFEFKQNRKFLNITKDSLIKDSIIEEVVQIVNTEHIIQDNKKHDIFRGQCLNLANAILLSKWGTGTEDDYIEKLFKLAEKIVKKGRETKFIN